METEEQDAPWKKLPLPVGNSDWEEVTTQYWSADKTQLISGLLERKTAVALFTRPRRFGKTFALRMLQAFFEKTEPSNARLFQNTKVWKNPAHRAEQGKYPVIFLTFKDAKGDGWELTRAFLESALAEEFRRHDRVFESENAKPEWKAAAMAIRLGHSSDAQLSGALGTLAEALHAHYGERPVILVDEYDSPINWAATHGFGEKALQFFRNFLSAAMKDGRHCRMAVMTGILRVAKEGVLSGLNNLRVHSVFDDDFSDCFGFTDAEVRGMLEYYGRPEKMEEAKAWYDGYRFGGREIYNPWSLLCYVDARFTPKAYWSNTSSNDLVSDVLSRMTPRMREALVGFFETGKSLVPCAQELGPYGTVQDDPNRIWPLLVHTGYLKVLAAPDANGQAVLAFPNKELRRVFKDEILAPISRTPAVGDDLQDILASLTTGDSEKFRKAVEAFLVSSASYFDTAHEDFFHGLLLGLLAMGRDSFEIKSNREAGDGRFDIAMKPRPGVPLPGVVLELKTPAKVPARASRKRIADILGAAAREARAQIDEKRYAEEMERAGVPVLKYGVGFFGKHVALAARSGNG